MELQSSKFSCIKLKHKKELTSKLTATQNPNKMLLTPAFSAGPCRGALATPVDRAPPPAQCLARLLPTLRTFYHLRVPLQDIQI